MVYKAIIFDLDGVICHTDKYHYQAWKSIADELGIYFDETINDRLRGVSRMESLDIVLENCHSEIGKEDREKLAAKKNEIYKKLLHQMSEKDLTQEVKSTLYSLRRNGLFLAIGSSSKNARFILEKIGLRSFFDAIADGNDIKRSKPDPEVFLKAAAFVHTQPGECLVIEDASAGLEAASAAGMDCAGIGDAAKTGKARYSLTTFSDILTISNLGGITYA